MPPLRDHFALPLVAIAALVGLANDGLAQPKAQGGEPYGALPAQIAMLCYPQPASAPSPGVLLIHGGGWTGGKAAALKGRCELFAQHGFVAAILEYRLAGEGARWPAQRDDARLALQWLRAHSSETGLDPDHICAYGESAGGHIALALGAPEDKVACIVDGFGPTDLTALQGPAYQRSFDALLGPEEAGREERAREASPLFNLGPEFPPTLIIHGESDTLIPPDQSIALLDALYRLKRPVTAILYRGGHSWLGLDQKTTAAIMNHITAFMASVPRR